MKNGVFSLFLFIAFSCNGSGIRSVGMEESRFIKGEEKAKLNQYSDSVTLAGGWLVIAIEDFFANFGETGGDYSSFCTDRYVEFKKDATHVNIDGYLNEEEFMQKWKHKQLEFAGVNDGFLISGQDFGTIQITRCTFKNYTKEGGWLFEAVLEDIEFETIFLREITVIQVGEFFLIDDVAEIENIYSK